MVSAVITLNNDRKARGCKQIELMSTIAKMAPVSTLIIRFFKIIFFRVDV